jgi:hypothetical protein
MASCPFIAEKVRETHRDRYRRRKRSFVGVPDRPVATFRDVALRLSSDVPTKLNFLSQQRITRMSILTASAAETPFLFASWMDGARAADPRS